AGLNGSEPRQETHPEVRSRHLRRVPAPQGPLDAQDRDSGRGQPLREPLAGRPRRGRDRRRGGVWFFFFMLLHAFARATLLESGWRIAIAGAISIGVGAYVAYTTNYLNQDVWTFGANIIALLTAAFTAAT